FFSLFTLPLIQGNPATALEAPLQIVLSETAAQKYFGTTDCLGKSLTLDKDDQATVSGIMKDMPQNSHFRVDILVSMSTLLKEWNPGMAQNWNRYGFYTYLLLSENHSAPGLSAKFPNFVREHIVRGEVNYSLSIEPLESVYLYGKPRGHRAGSAITGSISNVYIFSLIAMLVLFIAAFNFINLTMALSVHRSKEVEVKKILGASKRQLFAGFMTDAILMCIAGFFLALLCCALLLPIVNQVSGRMIAESIFERIDYIEILLLIALFTALIAGLYPAVSLAGIQPFNSLHKRLLPGASNTYVRKGLVITQFSISIILITATVVVFRQLDYMQNDELGFNKDQKLVVDYFFDPRITQNIETIRQQFTPIPGIDQVSISSSIPGKDSHEQIVFIENSNFEMEESRTYIYSIDHQFLNAWQIPIKAGRSFSRQLSSDSTEAMILNETAIRSLGYSSPEDAIGKRFRQAGNDGKIIGVVKDFHFDSFREPVQPLTLRMGLDSRFTFMTFNIASGDIQGTIRSIENKWRELFPDRPIKYFFSD